MKQYFLIIDSSENICSVSIFEDHHLICESISEESNDASSRLTLHIENVISQAKISLESLSAIGVFSGPGSYTGLRIAVSTAKGLCYSLEKPMIGINTLEAMANGFIKQNLMSLNSKESIIFLPMIDARRMEVYTQGFNQKCAPLFDCKAQILDLEFFNEFNTKEVICFGSGSEKCMDMPLAKNIKIEKNFKLKSSFGIDSMIEKFDSKLFEDIAYFEPKYLKDFFTPPKNN